MDSREFKPRKKGREAGTTWSVMDRIRKQQIKFSHINHILRESLEHLTSTGRLEGM